MTKKELIEALAPYDDAENISVKIIGNSVYYSNDFKVMSEDEAMNEAMEDEW